VVAREAPRAGGSAEEITMECGYELKLPISGTDICCNNL
jgi:hypothetical protein